MLGFYFKGHPGRSEWVGGQAGGQEGTRRATPVVIPSHENVGVGIRFPPTISFRGVLYQAD